MTETPQDIAKRAAATAGAALVEDGMRVGLGTGSTASLMVEALAVRVRDEGLRLRCAATSEATAALGTKLGLAVEPLDGLGGLDLALDGADEVDPDLNLIKGGGGALLREKIVAAAAARFVVLADPVKLVDRLGRFHLPVEIVPFGHETTRAAILRALDGIRFESRPVVLRLRDGKPFVSDEGHHILDLALEEMPDPRAVHEALIRLPGVVETGLFLRMAERALVGKADGTVAELLSEVTQAEEGA